MSVSSEELFPDKWMTKLMFRRSTCSPMVIFRGIRSKKKIGLKMLKKRLGIKLIYALKQNPPPPWYPKLPFQLNKYKYKAAGT